ncbi:MAG: ATP-binding protein [Lachnospiraceae bacterium]|nr:ATP-binding protein [Lachnospiraceae bacterium]
MKFIGRKEFLNKLKKQVDTDEMSFSLIYGRRRVGKSELVKETLRCASEKSIYFECKQVAEESNVVSLSAIVSDVMGLPKLGYTDIESLLDYIFKLAVNEKLILVLDEYPYLRESVKGLDSILQSQIDKYRESSKLKLIILGSYVEIMRSLLEHSNPLYGRVDLTIDLKQMDYYESALFYPEFSPEDKVRIYSVFGGIPYYNRLIDDKKSVRDNMIDLIASSGARLENEVSMYLSAEISKIINANEVFEALARGYSRYSDILSQSHVSSGPTLIDVLEKLIKMEVVVKTAPINDPNNKRKVGYQVADNLSLFYYRYIFKYLSQITIMDSSVFFSKYIEKDFEEKYVPHQFEEICKQYLIRENKAGNINPVFEKIGKYYYDNPKEHTNGEFDIVTEDELGFAFYEVKFRKAPVSKSMVEDEIAQVDATGLKCYKYVFFSRSGYEEMDFDNVVKIDIKALFD